ncbi:DUF805 domain-containing protein [Asticcacaulis solisilvae]|uniref:DUF805 domain-containing protein n=1 Tax=Asticcacaulis solisilvae TaxID=1217274 RepID=UPI003FD8FCA0
MILFFVPVLAVLALIAAGVVFAAAWPFLSKPDLEANRFGPPSETRTPMQAVVSGFARSLDFTGRSNRMDFWSFAIFIAAGAFASLVLLFALGWYLLNAGIRWDLGVALIAIVPMMLAGAYVAIACLSMAVRRLHDVNTSGWLVLLLLVFGYFILLYLFLKPSRAGADETARAFG